MKHMNADHAESVLAYAHWYAKMPEAKKATMLACTEEGFLLQVEWQGGGDRDEPETVEILVKYAAGCEVSSARDLHKAAVAMHMEAFRELGFVYRVKTGYYRRLAGMAAGVAKKKIAQHRRVVFPATGAIAALAAYRAYCSYGQKSSSGSSSGSSGGGA